MDYKEQEMPEEGIFAYMQKIKYAVKIEQYYTLIKDIHPISFFEGVLLPVGNYILTLGYNGMVIGYKPATQRIMPDNKYPDQGI